MFFLQRREYKSKFLEVETEASRTKDRLEMMNHMLDEMQEKMWEVYQNDVMMINHMLDEMQEKMWGNTFFKNELMLINHMQDEMQSQSITC